MTIVVVVVVVVDKIKEKDTLAPVFFIGGRRGGAIAPFAPPRIDATG